MPGGEEHDGVLALRLITDHIQDCTRARNDTKDAIGGTMDAIKDVRNLLVSFIAAVGGVVVIFAGYTYVQAQTVQAQLTQARIAQATATAEIPEKTAEAVRAKLPPNSEQPIGSAP